MQLQQAVNNVFAQLAETINQLSAAQFTQPCRSLRNNTIGQHVRHIIELFQCLDNGYATNIVNYESRKRDVRIETDKTIALQLLREIHSGLSKPDKEMVLHASYDEQESAPIAISTNYFREIAYNLEHTIHHMALIRVGIGEVSDITLPENFGVASSTIKHRKQCAQ